MKKTFLISILYLAGVFSSLIIIPDALGQSLTQRHSPRLMQGIRPLGMGGAFVAVDGTDENALFYNPAAINDYEAKFHFQYLLPTVEVSYKAIPFFTSDLLNLADDINGVDTNSEKINIFKAFSAVHTGRYEEIGVRGPIIMVMHKYLTIALVYENRSVLALLNPSSSTIDLEATTQGGIIVGSSYSLWDDKLQGGLALKFLGRYLINEQITQRDIVVNDNFGDAINYKRFGMGIGVDVGLKGKLPIKGNKVWDYLDPTWAITVQDVGDTRFFIRDNVGRIEESVSLGFALHPDFSKFKTTFAFDVRDLDHRGDFINKWNVGYEFSWPDVTRALKLFALRVGFNQGYVTGGFGFDFRIYKSHYFRINAATYGREIANQTRQKQSRMFGLQLATGF